MAIGSRSTSTSRGRQRVRPTSFQNSATCQKASSGCIDPTGWCSLAQVVKGPPSNDKRYAMGDMGISRGFFAVPLTHQTIRLQSFDLSRSQCESEERGTSKLWLVGRNPPIVATVLSTTSRSRPPHNDLRFCSPEPMITTPTTDRTSLHELSKAARRRLKDTPYHCIRGLICECDERGVLYLRGRLPSYYQKQLAQETVVGLPGIIGIVNQTKVVDGAIANVPA